MVQSGGYFVYFAAFAANLVAFAVGWGYAWSSPALPKLNGGVDPDLNPLDSPTTLIEESWIAACFHLGSSLGPVIAGPMADRIGRKKSLLLFAVPSIIGNVMAIFAGSVLEFLVSRILQGITCGCMFTVMPLYIAEIAEAHNRGTLSIVCAIILTFSGLVCYCVGPFIDIAMLSYIVLVPLILFLILFGLFVPESPYYCMMKNDSKSAENSLMILRRKSRGSVEKELLDITNSIKENSANTTTILEIFKHRNARKAIIISITLMFFQQLSGFCGIMAYLQTFFEATGSNIPSDISVMLVGLLQFLSIVLTSILIDKLGRRILYLISSAACFTSLMSLGTYFLFLENNINIDSLSWLPITSVLVFIVGFSLGLGPLPWTVMSEILPTNAKFYGSTLVASFVLFASFMITMLFPTISKVLGMSLSMYIFGAHCFGSILFVYFCVPETKGKSFEQIQDLLSGRRGPVEKV